MKTKTFVLFFLLPILAFAEESALEMLSQRQAAFGQTIPQEKVFIHMDNTSYQLGDTIWFSAYTRRTDTDKPSDVSGVLYVELYGQEGYMIERKLIQMEEGHGSGFFALNKYIQYAGFYELRAYTRWQLNWGRFERKHTEDIKTWFASKRQEKEYFRDYEKLYSRVFPVYDKPLEPGEYTHDMTLRAMRRLYPNPADNPKLTLSLYPEGGNLVEGMPCRVAFEACFDTGEWAEGWVVYDGDSIKTVNRGRGLFEVIPQKGLEKEVLFVSKDGKQAIAKLPKPELTGVSLKVEQTDSGWVAHIRHTADLQDDSLGVSLMCEGKLVKNEELRMKNEEFAAAVPTSSSAISSVENSSFFILRSSLNKSGVYQLTVFDTKGRVFADRLFFNRGKEDMMPTLSIKGLKEEYQPYEPVNLTLKAPPSKSSISISVRDDFRRDCLYDDSNILTEMLLSSEIRGFVPQPGWYFEADDEEHRAALDLLMMTQGWRRFDWRSMAVAGAWDITQPAERAPILIGTTYKNVIVDFVEGEETNNEKEDEEEYPFSEDGRSPHEDDYYETKPMDLPDMFSKGRSADREKIAYDKSVNAKNDKKNRELKVHAEIIALDAKTSFVGESETRRKDFRIQLPPDTTKWKKNETYTWIQAEPDNLETDYMYLPASAKLRRKIFVEPADYLPRIVWPYPRFVNPYSYYQNHLAPSPEEKTSNKEWVKKGDETIMSEVTVKARRNTLRKFDDSWPILAIDAEKADNMSKDYGLGFMQIMVMDYGVAVKPKAVDWGQEATFETRYGFGRTRRMLLPFEIPPDSIYARKYLNSGSFKLTTNSVGAAGVPGGFGTDAGFYLSPGESMEYQGTGVWDMYVLYSDYSPRQYGNNMYYGSNEPKTKLVQYPFPDGSRRLTYRDRRYVLEGFAYPAQFYSPDYSKQIPSEDKKDYRRTLYWNPNLKLNDEGEAEVKFFNNSRVTQLSVDAEGQASDGTLLWAK